MSLDQEAVGTVTPSRRAVARAAVWSAPVLAVAASAPAFAASCSDTVCRPYTIDWDQGSRFSRATAPALDETSVSATYTLPLSVTSRRISGANTLRLTIASLFSRNMRSGVRSETSSGLSYTENLTITDGVRDPGAVWSFGKALQLHQQVRGTGSSNVSTGSSEDVQVVTFTFSEAVCSLAFTMWDVDRMDVRGNPQNDFGDTVAITGATYTSVLGSQVTGTGSVTSPFSSTDGSDNTVTDSRASVQLTFAAPVTSFTLSYWNNLPRNYNGGAWVDGDQRIMISDMTVGVYEFLC